MLPTSVILVVLMVFGRLLPRPFNPAVTLAFALRAGLPWSTAAVYIVVQLLGGIIGVGWRIPDVETASVAVSITVRMGPGTAGWWSGGCVRPAVNGLRMRLAATYW